MSDIEPPITESPVPYLSYSKIDLATLCSLAFRFKYIDKIPEPQSGTMHAGSVVHAVIEHALNQVILGRPLPDAKELDDIYPVKWKELVAEEENKDRFIGWEWDEDAPEKLMFEQCRALVKLARDEVLPKVKPKFVEHEVNFNLDSPIGPFRVNGYIDLVEDGGLVTDWKTTAKVSDRQRKAGLQLPCYSIWQVEALGLASNVSTHARKVFLVRGRKPHVVEMPFLIHERQRKWFAETAAQVWMMINGGGYVPSLGSWKCKPGWCPYYAGCVGGVE